MGFWFGIGFVAMVAFASSLSYVMVRDTLTVEEVVDDFYATSQVGQTTSTTLWQVINTTVAGLDVVGPTGGTGPNGSIGANGTRGATGATGGVGPVGPMGPTGSNATLLVTGPTGSTGVTGNAGVIGPIGPTGARGPNGTIGPNGTSTTPGPTGPAGEPTPDPDPTSPVVYATAISSEHLVQSGQGTDAWNLDYQWFEPLHEHMYFVPITIDETKDVTSMSIVVRILPRNETLTGNCTTATTYTWSSTSLVGITSEDEVRHSSQTGVIKWNELNSQVSQLDCTNYTNGTANCNSRNVSMPSSPFPLRSVFFHRSTVVFQRGNNTGFPTQRIPSGTARLRMDGMYEVYWRNLTNSTGILATLTPGRYFVVLAFQRVCNAVFEIRSVNTTNGGLGYDILSTPGQVKPVLGYYRKQFAVTTMTQCYDDYCGGTSGWYIREYPLKFSDVTGSVFGLPSSQYTDAAFYATGLANDSFSFSVWAATCSVDATNVVTTSGDRNAGCYVLANRGPNTGSQDHFFTAQQHCINFLGGRVDTVHYAVYNDSNWFCGSPVGSLSRETCERCRNGSHALSYEPLFDRAPLVTLVY